MKQRLADWRAREWDVAIDDELAARLTEFQHDNDNDDNVDDNDDERIKLRICVDHACIYVRYLYKWLHVCLVARLDSLAYFIINETCVSNA